MQQTITNVATVFAHWIILLDNGINTNTNVNADFGLETPEANHNITTNITEDLPKMSSKEVLKMCILSREKKSSNNCSLRLNVHDVQKRKILGTDAQSWNLFGKIFKEKLGTYVKKAPTLSNKRKLSDNNDFFTTVRIVDTQFIRHMWRHILFTWDWC